MEIIKLGDRVLIPSKNVKGEIAYIGKPHFADGTWFGIILDDPIGKHNGIIDGKCYFRSEMNHGMFLRSSYFERECVDIIKTVDNRCSLVSKSQKYPNYSKVTLKQKTETIPAASNSVTSRKTTAESQNEGVNVLGDNVTNTNEENKELMKITEGGDNCDDFEEKKIELKKRKPNYLKKNSRATGNQFCVNKNKSDKTDNVTVDDAARNGKKLMLPTIDSNDNPDKDENESQKKTIYPNYLKASSKLTVKHLCKAKRNGVNDEEINETPEKTLGIQTSKECEDNEGASENLYAHLIKYPYHPKTSSNIKENSCSARKNETGKQKSMSKNEDCKIQKNDHNKEFLTELEAMKHENEDMKRKLKCTETSLEEIFNKYTDAQEEIKHLKYDNECQRKQIKFQKNHLKLLKMSQGSHYKKTVNNKISKQKQIDEILESILNKHGDSKNASEGKCDLKNPNVANSIQRVLELEEQNRVMIQGLVEVRNFLKKQCESRSIKLLNSNSRGRSPIGSNRKRVFSEPFDLSSQKSEASISDESAAQETEYSEMLQKMTKFNELMKEKSEYVKNWEVVNLAVDDNILTNVDLNDINHRFVQPEENSSDGPNKHRAADGMPLESVDYIHKISHEMPTKNLISDESSSLSTTTLIEQDVYDDEVPENAENCSSKIPEATPEFSVDLPCNSTSMTVRSNGDSPMMLSKSKRSNRKMPASTELQQCRKKESMNK